MGFQNFDALPALERTPNNVPQPPHYHVQTTVQIPAGKQRLRLLEHPDADTLSLLLQLDPDNQTIHYRVRSRRLDVGEYWQTYKSPTPFGTQVLAYPSRASNFILIGHPFGMPILSLSQPGRRGRVTLELSRSLTLLDSDAPQEWNGLFPIAGAFHQGRLFLGNHSFYPGRLWGSNSLQYLAGELEEAERIRFEFRDNDTSSIDVSLAGDERIVWMHPAHDRLLVGSNRAEYVISAPGAVDGPERQT